MVEQVEWLTGPSRPDLRAGQIHVWQAALDQNPEVLSKLRASLSADELDRAARFRFEIHRERFIAGRGILRDILARYTGTPPPAIEFTYGDFGKPSIRNGNLDCQVRLNVSHSGGLALYAFALNIELGVDLEEISGRPAGLDIATRYFSDSEVAALRALPPGDQREGFFNCWTRKEAYVKAVGAGLQFPLDSFDVSLAPGEPAILIRGQNSGGRKWSIRALRPAPGYSAALVAEGDDWEIHCMRWPAAKPARGPDLGTA